MSTIEIIATVLGGLTVGSALMVILSTHPVRSVMFLILTFFLISGNYILMNAQFLAIVNIIVLMLLNLSKDNEPRSSVKMKFAATAAGGSLVVVLIAAIKDVVLIPVTTMTENNQGMVESLGQLLFTKYVLPFEVSSILFIASMVGAVLLSKKEKQIID
jgi:NADH-quinone oxidoreductase subunit J